MPELTAIHIAIITAILIVGIILGWATRGSRASSEKAAISDGWQEQLDAQRIEHERLAEQNKSLMEQNSQYQASNKDAKMRASELSDALKEAFARRDDLQRQLKDVRSNFEKAVSERDQLRSDVSEKSSSESNLVGKLQRREARIASLKEELQGWQDRLPPLIDRYRERDEDANALEEKLAAAEQRIVALEDMVGSEQTRVEPVDPDSLGDDIDASNEPIEEHVEELSGIEDPADLLEADEFVEASDDPEELIDADTFLGAIDETDSAVTSLNDSRPDHDSAPRDNLKLIKGVGPAIEKTLNELGIRRFDQIAAMSEYDIERVANRLKGFRSRIYREDWIGQARELQDQKASGQ